jgi:hypothetical protein
VIIELPQKFVSITRTNHPFAILKFSPQHPRRKLFPSRNKISYEEEVVLEAKDIMHSWAINISFCDPFQ